LNNKLQNLFAKIASDGRSIAYQYLLSLVKLDLFLQALRLLVDQKNRFSTLLIE